VDSNCPIADQRGVLRPQFSHCDSRAYEYDTANSLKTTVLGRINTSLPSLSANAAQNLSDVIEPLSDSVEPSLWAGTDGNHLNPSSGEQVFEDEEKTVGSLSQLIVDETQLLYIENLVLADRTLASVAASGGNLAAIAELAKGDASATAGQYVAAIEYYKNAWLAKP
jgi:hypothetical protein